MTLPVRGVSYLCDGVPAGAVRRDLDMAGFGLVRVAPDGPLAWRPKAAFHEVARRYGALVRP